MVGMRKYDQSVDWSGVKSPGMVSDVVHLENPTKHPNDDNDDDGDDVSIASSADSRVECDGAVVLNNVQDKSPCFQNIEVTNSSDVHFGNKTYYQGPVTIKQILYSNPSQSSDEPSDQNLPITDQCGTDNSAFTPDTTNGVIKNGNISTTNHNNNINWTKCKGNKWFQARTKKQIVIGTVVLMLIVVCAVALTVALLTTQRSRTQNSIESPNEELEINKPNNDPEDPDSAITFIPKRVDRNTWLAVPEEPGVVNLKTPVPYVVIHHTATEECRVLADCKAQVQTIQAFHMKSNKWSDIGYNFLVGGDGYEYEGRGWTKQGAHVLGYNNVSIGIAFIGLFNEKLPPERQILAAKHLIEEGVRLNYIRKDYKLLAMRQLSTFKSPGQALYENMKTWPHWSPTL